MEVLEKATEKFVYKKCFCCDSQSPDPEPEIKCGSESGSADPKLCFKT
jgi:hypothetical protein